MKGFKAQGEEGLGGRGALRSSSFGSLLRETNAVMDTRQTKKGTIMLLLANFTTKQGLRCSISLIILLHSSLNAVTQ